MAINTTPNKKPTGGGNPTAGGAINGNDFPTMASDWHQVGRGYSCRFTLQGGQLNVAWRPAFPRKVELRRIWNSGKYHEARHIFLTAVSERIGGAVVCVDM